ncbi:Endosomal/lysosomal potassium channel TMEM175 [Balamuthia mandrillaris]
MDHVKSVHQELYPSPREQAFQLIILMVALFLGFTVIGRIMRENRLSFHWLDGRQPLVVLFGLLHLSILCLASFATQSLLASTKEPTAIYFYSGIMSTLSLSNLLLLVVAMVTTRVAHELGRQKMVVELLLRLSTILVLVLAAVLRPVFGVFTYFGLVMTLQALQILSGRFGAMRAAKKTKLEGYPKERMEAFTDGVYAVAMTLLIVDVTYPLSFEQQEDVYKFVQSEWRSFVGHFVTFVVLGFQWWLHNHFLLNSRFDEYHELSATSSKTTPLVINDTTTFWLNHNHCFFVALFPFALKLFLIHDQDLAEIYWLAPFLTWIMMNSFHLLFYFYSSGRVKQVLVWFILVTLYSLAIGGVLAATLVRHNK